MDNIYEMGWLNYQSLTKQNELPFLKGIHYQEDDQLLCSAAKELRLAVRKFYGIELKHLKNTPAGGAGVFFQVKPEGNLSEEGYRLILRDNAVIIEGKTSKGVLYGTFALIRGLMRKGSLSPKEKSIPGEAYQERILEEKSPDTPLRMLNHWDNLDGSIERGYAGNSFFFREDKVLVNKRTRDYARLAASVGINGVVINNVNVRGAATWLITDRYFKPLRQVQKIFAAYGIKLFLSLNFAAPMELGGLKEADPLSQEVIHWWKLKMKEVYSALPGLGGFLIKADSEGRPGPFTYGRSHSEGANMLAEAVSPYGGIIIWRCFVYNCRQDWRDKKTDRARASYDNFMPLDGKFSKNVILQIKNGPMDFQVREPVTPLFGGLRNTNQMLEVQIAQEYTGQQKHVCYLIPEFKEVLDFPTGGGKPDTVADIISGKAYGGRNCGIAAVANTGADENWAGHDLAAANFYGFGRLAFDNSLTSEEIAEEWITATFGTKENVMTSIKDILLGSWHTYEKYTSPLGIGWMVNPSNHFGPNPEGYEYDRWGTYHRADHLGIGVDRSSKGTGYATLYQEPNASMFEKKETCPEELLLFFHYVEYKYLLKSNKTLIQHIYDSHFEGVDEVAVMVKLWRVIREDISPIIYNRVLERLLFQEEHAREWRDVLCSYFYRKSGIPDERGRELF